MKHSFKSFVFLMVLMITIPLYEILLKYQYLESLGNFYSLVGYTGLGHLCLNLYKNFTDMNYVFAFMLFSLIYLIENFYHVNRIGLKYDDYPSIVNKSYKEFYLDCIIILILYILSFIYKFYLYIELDGDWFVIVFLITVGLLLLNNDRLNKEKMKEIADAGFTIKEDKYLRNETRSSYFEMTLLIVLLSIAAIYLTITPIRTFINNLNQYQTDQLIVEELSIDYDTLCKEACFESPYYKINRIQFTIVNAEIKDMIDNKTIEIKLIINQQEVDIPHHQLLLDQSSEVYLLEIDLSSYSDIEELEYRIQNKETNEEIILSEGDQLLLLLIKQ